MAKHIELGKRGEYLAGQFLQQNHYEILEKNWRYGRAEIDLIARQNQTIVFVEVKTRSHDFFQAPKDAVRRKKERMMIQASHAYLEKIQHEGTLRFDIISIVFHHQQPVIEHLEDAFFPGFFYGE